MHACNSTLFWQQVAPYKNHNHGKIQTSQHKSINSKSKLSKIQNANPKFSNDFDNRRSNRRSKMENQKSKINGATPRNRRSKSNPKRTQKWKNGNAKLRCFRTVPRFPLQLHPTHTVPFYQAIGIVNEWLQERRPGWSWRYWFRTNAKRRRRRLGAWRHTTRIVNPTSPLGGRVSIPTPLFSTNSGFNQGPAFFVF